MKKFIKKLLILFFCILLCSCKTKTLIQEVPVEVPQIHTEYVQKYDSVYIHDSIYQIIEKKNDTVYNTKTIIQYKYKAKGDTILIIDSISKPVYITKTEIVEKEVVPWNKILFVLISIIIVFIIYKFRK